MKNILSLLFLFCFILVSNAQTYDEVYNFPIKPGVKEWEILKTEKERFAALQIPDSLLRIMSTENLIITCINFPSFGHFTAFENPQIGFTHLVTNFNGLQELLIRPDAPTELLSIYMQMDSITMKISNEKIINRFWIMRSHYFELILAQEEIIGKMEERNKIDLLIEARKKINYKIDYMLESSSSSIYASLLIIGRILEEVNFPKFNDLLNLNIGMKQFIETGFISSPTIVNSLIGISDYYVMSKKQ